MKLNYLIFWGLLVCIPAFTDAQNSLRSDLNLPHPEDELVKQQVEYQDPGHSGRNSTWDFRFLQPVNEEYDDQVVAFNIIKL